MTTRPSKLTINTLYYQHREAEGFRGRGKREGGRRGRWTTLTRKPRFEVSRIVVYASRDRETRRKSEATSGEVALLEIRMKRDDEIMALPTAVSILREEDEDDDDDDDDDYEGPVLIVVF